MKIVNTAVVIAALTLAGGALAQSYPARNVVFISSVAGGASEAYLRAVLDKVRENTGATLVFEPRPGANGAPALQALKAANPDGHVLGITYASAMNLNPQLNKDLGIDVLRDFQPVTNLMTVASGFAAAESFQGKDLRDLVAMAKARPGTIKIGVYSAGNRVWLALLEERSGAKFLTVPYKTPGEAMTATLGGHIEGYIDTMTGLTAQRGKFKTLVNGGVAPAPQQPGVPLMRDLYSFDLLSWYGVIAAAGTPAGAVSWMTRELTRAIRDPKIRESIEAAGLSVLASTAEEFGRVLRAEIEANAEIVRKYPDIR